ncbi:MAG TPA: hypothetical protein VL098_12715 [Flavipsychrobacter sp.]|nr:hypothetical protein [Flavipsychrobacter sp.]
MTNTELSEFLKNNYFNHLSYAVENNPTGTYAAIKSAYGSEIDDWAPGFEKNEESKKVMLSLLDKKAKESSNPDLYAAQMLASIPYNQSADNWTKIA